MADYIGEETRKKAAARRKWKLSDAESRFKRAESKYNTDASKFKDKRRVSEELRSRRGMSDLIKSGNVGGKQHEYKEDTTDLSSTVKRPGLKSDAQYKKDYLSKNKSLFANADSKPYGLKYADFGKNLEDAGISKDYRPDPYGYDDDSADKYADIKRKQKKYNLYNRGWKTTKYNKGLDDGEFIGSEEGFKYTPADPFNNSGYGGDTGNDFAPNDKTVDNMNRLNSDYLASRNKEKMGLWETAISDVGNQTNNFNDQFIQDRDPSMSKRRKFEKKKVKGAGAPTNNMTGAAQQGRGLMNSMGQGMLS